MRLLPVSTHQLVPISLYPSAYTHRGAKAADSLNKDALRSCFIQIASAAVFETADA